MERPAVRKVADAKRKAQLWLEFAQSPLCIYSEDMLKAYDKAIALDPELAAAYLGRANVRNRDYGTHFTMCDAQGERQDPECPKKLAAEVQRVEGALADVDRAIALDDGSAEAYAKRVEILSSLKEYQVAMPGEIDTKTIDQRILEDVNRAIALGSVAKPYLYEQRAIIHADAGKPDRALADMTQAIQAKEAEPPDSEYGGAKPLGQYYLARADFYRGPDREEKAKKDRQKAIALFEEGKKKLEDEQREQARLLENSEVGKLRYELEVGYLERATGVSIKSLKGWSSNWPPPLQQQVMKKIEERIRRGQATAEEYLFMGGSYAGGEEVARDRYLDEGIRRLKPQAADPVKAMRLVWAYERKAASELYPEERFDAALKTLDEARAVIDRYNPRAVSEFADLMRKRTGPPSRELMLKVTRLGREDALAMMWWHEALSVGRDRVRVYDKLGLASKARAEYQYLCALQDQDACQSLERLK